MTYILCCHANTHTYTTPLVATDTYVMKLFDRNVDLAQFDEGTPLYPVCRAWIRNQPLSRDLSQERSPTPKSSTEFDDVNKPCALVSYHNDPKLIE